MGIQELSNLELVEIKENWIEKSQNITEREDNSEVKDFEDII